jgi:RNA polymerase sigma factor (sigma-70 family)
MMDCPTSLTDAQIIKQSKTDGEVFVELFRRHFGTIHRYVARRAGSDVADEIASETFAEAFRVRASYVPLRDSTLPWLYGIAGRQLLRRRRNERRYLRASGRLASQMDDSEEPAFGVSTLAEQRALGTALARLNSNDREALLLFAWGDLTYLEIAEAAAVPIGTVRSRISRARRALREELEDQDLGTAITYPFGGESNA